jgi:neutral ceramidase
MRSPWQPPLVSPPILSPKTGGLHHHPRERARIGPFAIATNAGELFVEWGISVKQRSPFPHTVLNELTNDWVGYEPTDLAFQHEGYETLAGANFVSLQGIQKLVDTSVELLQELWKKDGKN